MKILNLENHVATQRHNKLIDLINQVQSSQDTDEDEKIIPIILTKTHNTTILEIMNQGPKPPIHRFTRHPDGTVTTELNGKPADLRLTGRNPHPQVQLIERAATRILQELLQNEESLEAVSHYCTSELETKGLNQEIQAAAAFCIYQLTQKARILGKERTITLHNVQEEAAKHLKKHIVDAAIIRLSRGGGNSRDDVSASKYNTVLQTHQKSQETAKDATGLLKYYSRYATQVPQGETPEEIKHFITQALITSMRLDAHHTPTLIWALEHLDMPKLRPRQAGKLCRTLTAAREANPHLDPETAHIFLEVLDNTPDLAILEEPEDEPTNPDRPHAYRPQSEKRNAKNWRNTVIIIARDRVPGSLQEDLRIIKKDTSYYQKGYLTRDWDPQENTWSTIQSYYTRNYHHRSKLTMTTHREPYEHTHQCLVKVHPGYFVVVYPDQEDMSQIHCGPNAVPIQQKTATIHAQTSLSNNQLRSRKMLQ